MYTEQRDDNKIVAAFHDTFNEPRLAALMEHGKDWSGDQAVTEALVM